MNCLSIFLGRRGLHQIRITLLVFCVQLAIRQQMANITEIALKIEKLFVAIKVQCALFASIRSIVICQLNAFFSVAFNVFSSFQNSLFICVRCHLFLFNSFRVCDERQWQISPYKYLLSTMSVANADFEIIELLLPFQCVALRFHSNRIPKSNQMIWWVCVIVLSLPLYAQQIIVKT